MSKSQSTAKIIKHLNQLLAQEHACAIRYATHAAIVSGPYAEQISARLKEISTDELLHAETLRGRVLALGGTPTMEVAVKDLIPAKTLTKILSVNIKEEKQAIVEYTALLKMIPKENVILYQSIEEIIRDEQEHLEELEALRS